MSGIDGNFCVGSVAYHLLTDPPHFSSHVVLFTIGDSRVSCYYRVVPYL